MKLRQLSVEETGALVDELRGMSVLPAGANPSTLARAKEIRFQLQGQNGVSPTAVEKADEVYREFEILFHPHRWREHEPLDSFRKEIKSSCDRLRAHLGLRARPSV